MSETDQSSRTEEPTERRLQEARRKGEVAHSREPAAALGLVALLVLVGALAPALLDGLARRFARVIVASGRVEAGTGETGLRDLGAVGDALLRDAALVLAPGLAVMMALALAGVLAGGRVVVAPQRLVPKWSKISPLAGAKRLVSPEALIEFAKNLLKVVAVGALAGVVGVPAVTAVWTLPNPAPGAVLAHVGTAAARMLALIAALTAVVAVLDVLWKRHRHLKKQRMTPKEVRDERKDSEGDPHIKARRDGIRRRRARQRMAAAVPTATVVITNPVHYAVALRYEAGRDAVPVCVAKGTDGAAARIRELARAADVPVIENRPLARALHASVEVEDAVPAEHWRAVAEIIGYVQGLAADARRRPPQGSRLHIEA